MSYYFEIWLRGYAKDKLRSISSQDEESYHPHITLVRPFHINEEKDESKIENLVVNYCKNKSPIAFSLSGKNNFDNSAFYIPVTNELELFEFNNGLERLLENEVKFFEKLSNEKILHATINFDSDFETCDSIEQYMLRLTGIKDHKIWFSYDFVTKQTLNRDESLDKTQWYQTVHEFSNKYKLLPTRNGFKEI